MSAASGDLTDPANNSFIPSEDRELAEREEARKGNDFIPGSDEPFDPGKLWAAGYAAKYPLEPDVIEQALEEATAPGGGADLGGGLRLERLGRVAGVGVFKDGVPVNDLRTLSAADLKLIREYLDKGHGGNDLIP